MNKKKLILPITIVLGFLILGISWFAFNKTCIKENHKTAVQVNSQNLIEKKQSAGSRDSEEVESNVCDFALSDIKTSQYHKDGPDLNKIQELEDKLQAPCDGEAWTCELQNNIFESEINYERNSRDKLTWVEIEGVARLNGNKNQNIESVIARVYTDDEKKIFLGDGYVLIKKNLSPGTSYPFKFSVTLNRNDELVEKYFSKDDKIKVDVYPYFSSCKY